MKKKKRGVTAADILKAASDQTDGLAKDLDLDSAGKMIVYRYAVRLLCDAIDLDADISDPNYTDLMGSWLDVQIELSDTANADSVYAACLVTHAEAILARSK